MGIKTCPFCPSHGPEDAPDLVDHVLRQAYEFALRALPWQKPIIHNLDIRPGLFELPDEKDNETPFGRWIMESEPELSEAPKLVLCDYDSADHTELIPPNLAEYSDCFDEGGYFDDKSEDKSSRRQGIQNSVGESSLDTRSTEPLSPIQPQQESANIEVKRYGLTVLADPENAVAESVTSWLSDDSL